MHKLFIILSHQFSDNEYIARKAYLKNLAFEKLPHPFRFKYIPKILKAIDHLKDNI